MLHPAAAAQCRGLSWQNEQMIGCHNTNIASQGRSSSNIRCGCAWEYVAVCTAVQLCVVYLATNIPTALQHKGLPRLMRFGAGATASRSTCLAAERRFHASSLRPKKCHLKKWNIICKVKKVRSPRKGILKTMLGWVIVTNAHGKTCLDETHIHFRLHI